MNNEEIEVIVNREEGISYGELKRFLNLSMTTSNNLSKLIPSTSIPTSSSSSTTTIPTLFSSKNVKISKANKNNLVPFKTFKESCRACDYFGHSFKTCPNIKPEFRGGDFCLKCWSRGHQSSECVNDQMVVPFNEDYLTPEEVINYLLYK